MARGGNYLWSIGDAATIGGCARRGRDFPARLCHKTPSKDGPRPVAIFEAEMMTRFLMALMALVLAGPVFAQNGPLRLTITDGVIEPLPFAVPAFEALYDVFSGAEMGEGLQFAGTVDGWRRMGHKVADAAYSRITGEGGYFDSRVVFVSETGPKDNACFIPALARASRGSMCLTWPLSGRASCKPPKARWHSAHGFRVMARRLSIALPMAATPTSFLDEGPTWSPNGRVIMFMRETQGASGSSSLYTVDVSGRNLRPVTLPNGASDPSWGPLQR